MNNEKVNCFGVSTLILSLCNSAFYGTFSSYILYKTKTDSFLTIIIGFIISLLLSKIILHLFNKHPSKSFVKRSKVNKFNGPLYIILLMCTYILLSFRLSTFLSNQYLINTPNFVILSMIVLITYYTSSKGLETIIRVSNITFYISMFIFIFDFFSLVTQINIENFYPMFTTSLKDIIVTSILFSIFFITPNIYLNAIKKSQIVDSDKFNKYYYSMQVVSLIIILLNIFTTIGVSGVNVNNLFDYPIYTTLKRISLFSFLDSMENVSITLWLFFIINSCNMNLLFINNILKDLFNLSGLKLKIINIIIVFICFMAPVIIFNDGFVETYEYILLPSIVSSILIFLIFVSNIKDRFSN